MAGKRVRKKQNIPKDESKSDRFSRVVKPRVAKALKAIQQIGLCAGSTYESTDSQRNQILGALSDSVVGLKARFEKKTESQSGFEFK